MTDTLEPIYASDIECRCDCCNCVTGNHEGCYYTECFLKNAAESIRKAGK